MLLVCIWLTSLLAAIAAGADAQYYWTNPISVILVHLGCLIGLITPPDEQVYRMFITINIGLVILAAALAVKMLGNNQRDYAGDILGSSRWLSIFEAKKIFSLKLSPGILFGKAAGFPVVLPPNAGGNRNVSVLGPPGSMKSRGYVRNNLFQAVESGWSVIVTDPKGELTRDFKTFFEENDYTVKVFNLVDMLRTDRWNPLSEVVTDLDAQTFCEIIIANTAVAGRKSGDPFWDRAEMNLLKALTLYVVNQLPPEDRNMGNLYKILASGDSKTLDILFTPLPADHPAKMSYNIYAETSAQVRSGVIIGLGTRLQVFQNLQVRTLTETSDISMTMPGVKKCAYFCIISDMENTFDFLASLFFSFLFISLTKLADQNNGELNIPNNFILDEFCNIGKIPDFPKKISTMRGRGIACSVIFQSIGQLKSFYPDNEWETIMADCDSWLILGVKDVTSAEYISKHLGVTTIKTTSKSQDAGKILNLGKETEKYEKRNLLNPDEIAKMPKNQAILSAFGLQPLKIQKMDYTKHPMAKKLKPKPISAYVPSWHVPETPEEELAFGTPLKPEIKPITQPKTQPQEESSQSQDSFWT